VCLSVCLPATFQRLNHLTDDGNWCEHHASTVSRVTVISYTIRDNMVDVRD